MEYVMKKTVYAVYGSIIQTIGEVEQEFNQVVVGKFSHTRFYVCNDQFHPARDPLNYDTSNCGYLNPEWFDRQTNGDLMEQFEHARNSDDFMVITNKIQQHLNVNVQVVQPLELPTVEPEPEVVGEQLDVEPEQEVLAEVE